jgi:hypothetical protein
MFPEAMLKANTALPVPPALSPTKTKSDWEMGSMIGDDTIPVPLASRPDCVTTPVALTEYRYPCESPT